MSESTAKAERRALRRVAGDDVVRVVNDHDTAVKMLAGGVKGLDFTTQRHEEELRQIQKTLKDDYQHFERVTLPLCNSTLWTRLRWVVRGR